MLGKDFRSNIYGALQPGHQVFWLPHQNAYEISTESDDKQHIDGLVQDCSNSSALAMELL